MLELRLHGEALEGRPAGRCVSVFPVCRAAVRTGLAVTVSVTWVLTGTDLLVIGLRRRVTLSVCLPRRWLSELCFILLSAQRSALCVSETLFKDDQGTKR